MNRWIWFWICIVLGLVLLTGGMLVPAHLRAVDESVIQAAGRGTPSLVDRGLRFAADKNLGAAQLLLREARDADLPDRDRLIFAIRNLVTDHPAWQTWGGGDPRLESFFGTSIPGTNSAPEPFATFVVRLENREKALDLLRASTRPEVQELLRCRDLTNTVIFPPAQSASGQAFDAAVSTCGLLLEEGRLTPGLSNTVHILAAHANLGAPSRSLELVLMDFLSLGQRLNWGQLTAFVAQIQDTNTLRQLAELARQAGDQLPVLASGVALSGRPAETARYLLDFSQTGTSDLGESLRYGAGAVNELLQRDQPLVRPGFRAQLARLFPFTGYTRFALNRALLVPPAALGLKWLVLLASGFFLALALHFARPAVSSLERPLQVRGIHVFREILFALGFLLVVLVLSEPFLARDSQKTELRLQFHLPTLGGLVPAGGSVNNTSLMDTSVLLIVLFFFVVQGLLYVASLVKLAEIRRQAVPPRTKLKLLENEDHLFDAGLYIGFLGTIVSFVLVLMKVLKNTSLMAAYSSTAFGILFVVIFKIIHLRAARRTILLEAEADLVEPAAPVAVRGYATQP